MIFNTYSLILNAYFSGGPSDAVRRSNSVSLVDHRSWSVYLLLSFLQYRIYMSKETQTLWSSCIHWKYRQRLQSLNNFDGYKPRKKFISLSICVAATFWDIYPYPYPYPTMQHFGIYTLVLIIETSKRAFWVTFGVLILSLEWYAMHGDWVKRRVKDIF